MRLLMQHCSSSSATARACMCSSQDLDCFLDFCFFPSCAFGRPSIASRCFASKSRTLIVDIPQCDILSAPTSLVPSPHIRVIRPAPLNTAYDSFFLGASLANTEIRGTRVCNVDCASECSRKVIGSMKVLLVPPESCLIFWRTAYVAILVRVSPVTQTAAIYDDASILNSLDSIRIGWTVYNALFGIEIGGISAFDRDKSKSTSIYTLLRMIILQLSQLERFQVTFCPDGQLTKA